MKTRFVAAAFVLFTVVALAQQPRFDGRALWRRVEILSADDMEGRAPGSAGLRRANEYVVKELKKAGLAPAGVDGYFQPVTLVRRKVVERDASVALVDDGRVQPLSIGEQVFFANDVDAMSTLEVPLVFVGYGLGVPERHYDDLSDLDVKGKIVVTMPGSPESIDTSLAVQAAVAGRRWQHFRDNGAVGWIEIAAPEASWSFLRDTITTTTLFPSDPGSDDGHGMHVHLLLNPAYADALFDGTAHTAKELMATGKALQRLPRFALRQRLRVTARMSRDVVDSANVIAKLEGSDPRMRNEYVVLASHVDHLGIREPINGDAIYNGAVDNATGVAALLEIADVLKREHARLKRSVLFAFFTGEEDGRFGSKYFVAHPPVARREMVAALNVDGIQAITPLEYLEPLGARESDLGDIAQQVAASHGVKIGGDPASEAVRFANNADQLSFAFAGIPALKLNVGFPGALAAVQQKWRRERYHTPFDDAQQPINLDAIGRYEEIAHDLLLAVANAARRPAWKPGSVYERYAR